jgi:aryl-alcohol dehydrogenase-like predicted oxidoreductase
MSAQACIGERWNRTLNIGAVIIGATSMAQLEEDIAAAQFELNADTLAEIAAVQVNFPNPAG